MTENQLIPPPAPPAGTEQKDAPPPALGQESAGKKTPGAAILHFILHHPLVNLTISIAGLITGFIFFYASIRDRNLTYAIEPERIRILDRNRANVSDLQVLHRGREVNGDVTAVRMRIWVKGKEPIPSSSNEQVILTPLEIVSEPRVPILDASVLALSDSATAFSLSNKFLSQGRIPLEWDVLEYGDYADIQIIYEGKPDVAFELKGAMVGQREIRQSSRP